MTADENSEPAASVTRRTVLLVSLLLAIAALAAYRNTFDAPFVLDDGGSITENPTIRQVWPPWGALHPPGSGVTVSGRPLANLSLAVNYAISGEAVWSYHLFNLIIHWLAACTLFGIVRRTLEQRRLRVRFGGVQLPLAAAVAGLWLLHPLQTEAVTYICQRTESLAGLCALLTLYAFVRSVSGGNSRWWRAAAVLACLAGVATKEVVATVPLLVFLYDRTFVAGTFRAAWRQRRGLHLALAATWVPLGLLVAGTGWNRGGTAGFGVGVTPWAYWLTQFEAVVRYLQLSLWPHPLVFDYGTFWVGFRQALPFALVVLLLLAATGVALVRRPALGFVGTCFFVILAPTSIVPGTIQMIVEHRLYLPLAAVVTLIVIGAYLQLGRRSLLLWPVLALGLGALTSARNETYRSAVALWGDTVAKAPGNVRAHYNLGLAHSAEGHIALAVEQDRLALQLDTAGVYANKAYAVHGKLGHDLALLGRWVEAAAEDEAALRLKPDYALGHLNLARALVRLDYAADAIPHFAEALRLQVDDLAAESEFADALLREGRVAEAVGHDRAAVRLTPAWAPGFNNLGYALLLDGKADEAIASYREAVRLDPRYAAAWLGLGYALVQAGRPAEALAPCTEAVRLHPESADAHNTLGIALAQTGRTAAAINSFGAALRLKPTAADVHNNLGNALAESGRYAEALAQYREAVRLDADYAPAQRNLGEELRRAGHAAEAAEHLAAAMRLEADGRPVHR